MNILFNLQQQVQNQETLTTQDVLNALFIYINHYKVIFQNIVNIKISAPVSNEEPGFKKPRRVEHRNLFEHLLRLLNSFEEYLLKFDHEFRKTEQNVETMGEYNEKLLQAMSKAINSMQGIYEGHATTFAFVLNDLVAMQNIFLQKLKLSSESIERKVLKDFHQAAGEMILAGNEKLVFVRIFHREMPALATGKSNFNWIKPLLDSLPYAEKHGFAVYADEADVIKSLKDDHYGYVTLKIKPEQDITDQRAPKICPIVGCALLTITDITLDNLVQLTHEGVKYRIKEGVLLRKG